MSKIRAWKPDFRYYEELVGIECARRSDVVRLIEALLTTRDLRICPHEIIAKTIVIPKEAVRFLPLKDIKHKAIELRDTMSLSDKVNRELTRRFLARWEEQQPHYYTTGKGAYRICCRSLVLFSTAQAIETYSG